MTVLLPRYGCPARPTARLPFSSYRRAVVVAVCVMTIGCRPAERTHTYNVPKETVPRVSAASPSAKPTDRMLAAILPDGDKAWFFKVVAPLTAIDERSDKVTEFFASVRIADGKPHPDWQLPDGWQEEPGSGMRVATITIPSSDKPLELSVTSLPWTGTQEELLSNVNRWRGQLQLAPIGSESLDDCTRTLAAGDATLTVVNLRGQMQGTGMTPPFAAGGLGFPGAAGGFPDDIRGGTQGVAGLPPGHPPIGGVGPAEPVTLKYELPDGWQELPADGFRKAAFRIADGAREATVTAVDFPASAGPLIADRLANVNRWRSEVGLGPLAADDLPKATETIQVDDVPAMYVEAIPDASSTSEPNADTGTLAAMAAGDDVVWFFKITGDPELVVAQRDQFKSFLKSVRFTDRAEPSNGN